jgi:hypothetical protein
MAYYSEYKENMQQKYPRFLGLANFLISSLFFCIEARRGLSFFTLRLSG